MPAASSDRRSARAGSSAKSWRRLMPCKRVACRARDCHAGSSVRGFVSAIVFFLGRGDFPPRAALASRVGRELELRTEREVIGGLPGERTFERIAGVRLHAPTHEDAVEGPERE